MYRVPDDEAVSERERAELLDERTELERLMQIANESQEVAAKAARKARRWAIGSLVFSAFALGYALAQIPAGWLVDRVGPRMVNLPCMTIFGLAFASLGLRARHIGGCTARSSTWCGPGDARACAR